MKVQPSFYYVLTYDGSLINVYVNGSHWTSQSASGTIQVSTQAIVLGTNFTGALDELSVSPRALSAAEVLQRYQLYPSLALNQPFTPDSVPGGMTAGVVNTTYTFTFTAWDLNGNNLDYRIDWGTGAYQDTGYVPSGTVVQATHTWTSAGQYNIRVESVEPASTSAWSPTCNVLILSTSVTAAMSPSFLIGASANVGTLSTSSRTIANTVGEALTGLSSSTLNIGNLGYRGTMIAPSPWTAELLGRQGTGGTDAPPTSEMTASDLVTVQYSTSAADVSAIALNLLEHGTTTFTDANGNLQVENGRWIAYDFENRPVRVVTQDAVLSQFAYDFQGNRTQQTVTPLSQSSQTTTYVGGIYEITSTATIKYITAGPLIVAMQDSAGNVTYFLPDHLGSTNLLADSGQNLVRSRQYMPFGSTFQTSGTFDDDHQFTGQRMDEMAGLYYYNARYYGSLSGRFVSPDVIVQSPYDPQTLNRYAYTRSNPLIYIDPSGNSFFGNIGNFFNQPIGKILQQAGERTAAVSLLGFPELVPQVYKFSYKNRDYIAAGALTAATFGAAFGADAFGALLAGTPSLAQATVAGALAGELSNGLPALLNKENGGNVLKSTLVGGALGAVQGAAEWGINYLATDEINSLAINEIDETPWIRASEAVEVAAVGGTNNAIQHGSFIQGFEEGFAAEAFMGILQVPLINSPLSNAYNSAYFYIYNELPSSFVPPATAEIGPTFWNADIIK